MTAIADSRDLIKELHKNNLCFNKQYNIKQKKDTKNLDSNNLEIELLFKHNDINSKFEILQERLNESDKIRKLNQIRKMLMNSKKIHKKK